MECILSWINLIEFRLYKATERQLDFIEAKEEEDMIQKASALSNWHVVNQNAVAEMWPLFCTTHQNLSSNIFKAMQYLFELTHPAIQIRYKSPSSDQKVFSLWETNCVRYSQIEECLWNNPPISALHNLPVFALHNPLADKQQICE